MWRFEKHWNVGAAALIVFITVFPPAEKVGTCSKAVIRGKAVGINLSTCFLYGICGTGHLSGHLPGSSLSFRKTGMP